MARHLRPSGPGWLALLICLVLASLACSLPAGEPPLPSAAPPSTIPPSPPTATVTPAATSTPAATLTAPPATVQPDTGWTAVQPSLELRTLNLFNDHGDLLETITLVRLDAKAFTMDLLYDPAAPKSVQNWAAESGALLTINAGYFTPEYNATGLIVVDGMAQGVSYDDFAGMLVHTGDAFDLRWLAAEPYDPAEPLHAAVQSFPLLIKPGGELAFPEDDGIPGRRTAVARDRAGRILFIVCPRGYFTLHGLATYLLGSDLELDVALNLDGGNSTGLVLAAGEHRREIPSFTVIPAVLSINPAD